MNVTVARYLLGVATLAIVIASTAITATTLRKRFFPSEQAAQARLVEATIGLALLITLLELLGAVGLLRLVAITIASAVLALITTRAFGGAAAADPRAARVGGAGAIERLASTATLIPAAAAAGTLVAEWLIPTLNSYDTGIRTFDSLYYHLPWAATFAQTGHVLPLQYDIEYHLQFYPASAELLHALGIVLLARDTLSPALNLMWMALILLAAWCIGRPHRRAPLTLLGAVVALATPMITFSQAGSADNDIVGVFFLMAAIALVLNAPESNPARILAALAAGIAIGTKLTLIGPVLALTAGWIAIAHRGARRKTAALWLGPLVGAGCFWYLRNLFTAGNPLPWVSFGGILATPSPALQQRTGYTVAHYLTSSRFWQHFFVPGVASQLGGWWWAVLAIAVAGPLLCLAPRASRTTKLVGFVALASLVCYLLTPEGAQGPNGDPVGFGFNMRYIVPGLTLSLAAAPLAPVFDGKRRQGALALALAATLIGTVAQASLWPARHVAVAIIAGLVTAALFAAAALWRQPGTPWRRLAASWRSPTTRARLLPRSVLLAGALVLATAGAAAGYAWQRHYLRGRYVYQRGISHLSTVWQMFRRIHHVRVGVVGTYGGFFSYPLFGIDDSNPVVYVAQQGPHGSFTPIRSCQAFRQAVNRDHLRYLLTTPGRDFWRPRVLTPSPETAWTASDPAAHTVYSEDALGQPVVLFRLSRPLDPGGCG